jgi:O-antigen chain-terminating methyltransferase
MPGKIKSSGSGWCREERSEGEIMNNQTIEIRDEHIDVEEIMREIRENIRKKRQSGLLPPEPEIRIPLTPSADTGLPDIEYLDAHSNVSFPSYTIQSHQPFIGQFLVKGRSLVNGEVKRYVDPLLSRQSEWNWRASRIISNDFSRLNDLEEKVKDIDELFKTGSFSEELRVRIRQEFQNQLDTVFGKADGELRSIAAFQKIIAAGPGEPASLDKKPVQGDQTQVSYLAFEDQFRGSRAVIKDRQKIFLPYFAGCQNVLDIGCGRGEFLELMQEEDIRARGVDIDREMVSFSKELGFEVTLEDAATFLETCPDESLDGIFIDQVVEHLEPGYLLRLLELCSQKMKPGSYIIAETVNPLSFTSLANFYIDLSHVKPVHPQTLQYLYAFFRFREIEVKFLSPVFEQEGLRPLSETGKESLFQKEQIAIYNHNIRLLNNRIFGAQDYAVIGRKASR